jgi:hypothetical protein
MNTGSQRGIGAPWGGGELRSAAEAGNAGEGRDLSQRQQYVVMGLEIGNLSTPINAQKLQMALHAKAPPDERGGSRYVLRATSRRDQEPFYSLAVTSELPR